MSSVTVIEVIQPFLNERQSLGRIAPRTKRNMRYVLFNFADFVGDRKLHNIGPAHVEKWLISMEDLAPATRRIRLSMIRSFFAWANRKGYCRRNPAADVAGPTQPRLIPRALPLVDVRKVLHHCPDARGRLIMILMLQEGLRCGEVSRLTLGDIDRTHRTMRVSGKGGHERILPVTDEAQAAIDDYLGEWPASAGPLVRSYRHEQRPLGAHTISRLVGSWMWDAGIKKTARDGISAHAARHTAATDMLLGGAHLRDVQAALGHRRLTTTERYLPYTVHGLGEAMGGRTYIEVLEGTPRPVAILELDGDGSPISAVFE